MTAVAALLLAALIPAPASAQDSQPALYVVGPRDLLEIRVLEVPELNVERRVSDAGSIDLPLIGEFVVRGMSAPQAKDRLEAMLTAKYVNRANVSVVVKEFANKPLSVLGAVQRPGMLSVSGRYDLLQAIAAAGGLAPGSGRKIYVLRSADNGFTDQLEVSADELFKRTNPRWNIPVFPGDVINVPPRSAVRVFCLGEVKSPGALEFDGDDRITLLTVIARAGGLSDRAARGGIRIKRRGPDGKDQEIEASYSRIVSGKDADPELRPDDVVIVKESFF